MGGLMSKLEGVVGREAGGWCTPCGEGLPWTGKRVWALELGQGETGDIELLDKLAADCGPGLTFCAHAPGAAMPLQTALKHFRQEFEQGVSKPRGKAHQDPIPVGEI